MKKIDLHIHTVSSYCDRPFTFELATFTRYVREARLDAVAVTNHDQFDGSQFRKIQAALDIPVLPGIEINVDRGHLLVIADPTQLADFEHRTNKVPALINKIGDRISVDQLKDIFGDLSKYLLIPHYDKGPPISGETLKQLLPYLEAGEVDSAKKFVRIFKDTSRLTPVLFSDSRMEQGLEHLPTRQTFVDCGEVSVAALKSSFRDRAKVALTAADGNSLWQVLDNGLKLSTGLNVVLGARSSGKTHTLDQIASIVTKTKYIRQFSLVQANEQAQEAEFTTNVEKRRSTIVDQYLSGFKRVLDSVMKIDESANDRALTGYVGTLLASAAYIDRRDAYSNTAMFDEVEFAVGNVDTLRDLIGSVRQVIENLEYRNIIEKHVALDALKALIVELIDTYRRTVHEMNTKSFVNGIVKEVKQGLKVMTSAVQVQDVDLYAAMMDSKRMDRFVEIVEHIRSEKLISSETFYEFRIEARTAPFAKASELKAVNGGKTGFTESFGKYGNPREYLRALMKNDALARADLYKFFARIDYQILNKDGAPVSGGERSEFRLLQEIADAQDYDLLLIDEPESSFDNLFLRRGVNQMLKGISREMPVVVVTHNNTVGASVEADYLLYASKELESGVPVYRVYTGYPTDAQLKCVDGKAISSHDVLMNALEAGADAYFARSRIYEAAKHS